MQPGVDLNCFWTATRNAHLSLASIIALMWMIALIAAMFRAESLFSHDKSLMDNIYRHRRHLKLNNALFVEKSMKHVV
ncbi:Pre-rRNA-processing protein [Dirofilaria immitis]